jgi:hypothetical protein
MTALQDQSHDHGRDIVDVTYNGVDNDVPFQSHESMQALLHQALKAFSVTDNQHVMALWTEDGVELPNTGSVADAGVHPGQTLVLRPSAVRGG